MSYLDFDYSSGSGDLNPMLGEEACAPLWFKTSVLLPLLNFWQCYKVLVNVVTKSLVCPQLDLATMPTTKSSLSPRMKECFLSVIQYRFSCWTSLLVLISDFAIRYGLGDNLGNGNLRNFGLVGKQVKVIQCYIYFACF